MSDILEIFNSGLSAVLPAGLIRRRVGLKGNTLQVMDRDFNLSNYRDIYVIGAGKASLGMAEEIERILGERIKAGVCCVPVKYTELERIEVMETSHPIPDERSVKGTEKAISILRNTGKEDLIICLFSGGGSSLFALPAGDITLEDKEKTISLLLMSGADIKEINTIRKHISGVKGGRLATEAYPSTVISLLISDVVGDNISIIASGPTVSDDTTYRDCMNIIEKYNLMPPRRVLEHIRAGIKGDIAETPKSLPNVVNFVIGNNLLALESVREKAEGLRYNSIILSSQLEGEARDVARLLSMVAKEVVQSGNPVDVPACIISGGETTIRVVGSGKGGRNQELALAFAIYVDGVEGIELLSAATDGVDGPTDACGAIVDGDVAGRARAQGLSPQEYLQDNNSYHFHKKVGTILYTGPTHTNVGDIEIILCR